MREWVKIFKVVPFEPKIILGNASLDTCSELIKLHYLDCVGLYGRKNVVNQNNQSFDVYSPGSIKKLSFSVYIEKAPTIKANLHA